MSRTPFLRRQAWHDLRLQVAGFAGHDVDMSRDLCAVAKDTGNHKMRSELWSAGTISVVLLTLAGG